MKVTKNISMQWKLQRIAAPLAALLALAVAWPVAADPPAPNPFPTPSPRVFCFRVTDIEGHPTDPTRFKIQFEFLNWTNQPAYGSYIWVNNGTVAREGGPPTIIGAGVDPDGRGGPPGGQHIGPGIYNSPSHQSGRGRGDIPGHLNDWQVVFRGVTSVYWGDAGDGITPIPFRSILSAPSSAAQFALVPGLGNDGLLIPDSAIDGGPAPYGPPTQPAPFPAGGRPTPDGSGNVLDGLWIEVVDFHEGEVLSMNWIIADQHGNSIGQVGTMGNVIGDEMGFGLFNLVRIPVGDGLPPGIFKGNSGFTQGVNFYPGAHYVPDAGGPNSPAEFGVEFGAALTAPPLSPNVANEVPGDLPSIIVIPDIAPSVMPPNAEPYVCQSDNLPGDVNGSGVVNIADIQCLILVSTWQLGGSQGSLPACYQAPLFAGDLNCDDSVTVSDVQIVIMFVLGNSLPPELDGNGNGCHDDCECSAALCDDGNACTVDQCGTDGNCHYFPFGCDDGNPCTVDTCHPASGCIFAPVSCSGSAECPAVEGQPCDDGNACTLQDVCNAGTCLGVSIACDDGNPCTADNCNPATGCTHSPVANGTTCNGLDQCIGGFCVTPQGCTSDAECNAGGDICRTFACQAVPGMPGQNKCVIVSLLNCNDNNACTDDSCNPATGCLNLPNDENACDDGDDCNLMDACLGGACIGLGEVCDDGNPCSVDFCAPNSACYATPLHGPVCDDGNACTQDETCKIGHCLGDVVNCDDNSVCTIDSCNPASGCVHTPITCVDGNICTDDGCDAETGCTFTPNTAPCNDNNVCTGGDICGGGSCAGAALPCPDDGIACTVESCHPISGCSSNPSNALCNDGVSCTTDVCNASQGCLNTPNNAACNDGVVCTLDICDSQQGCTNEPDDAACDDGNPCTTNACGPISGCVAQNNDGVPCDDGNPLTIGDQCQGGMCIPGQTQPTGPESICWKVSLGDGEQEWFDFWDKPFDTLLNQRPMFFGSLYADIAEPPTVGHGLVSFELPLPAGITDFRFNFTFEGISYESSAVYLFWESTTGSFHNIACRNYNATSGTPALTPAEQAQIPYACGPNTGFAGFSLVGTNQIYPSGFTPAKLHLRALVTKINSTDLTSLRAYTVCIDQIEY